MLELRNISLFLKKSGRTLCEGLSFTIKDGEKAVLIGEEGNGKSTLLRYLYDPSLCEDYCDGSGDVITGDKVAYLPQTLDPGLENVTLADYFGDTEYYLHPDVLTRLGLDFDFILSERTLGSLSGGEKVKAQMARLLMEEPTLLLLDEPTNDLDIETLEWLEKVLAEGKRTAFFISHDEVLIERVATVIVHMEQLSGKSKSRITVVHEPYADYLSQRAGTFEHQRQVAKKQRDDYDKQMEKWRRIHDKVEHDQETISRGDPAGARLLKKKMHSVLSMGARFEREKEDFLDFPEEEEAILTKFDPAITVPGGKEVLALTLPVLKIGERTLAKDLRLVVTGHEHVGITGMNGAGKSTLLKEIWKELSEREDVTAAYMPQNYAEALDYEKTPLEFFGERFDKEGLTKARTFMGSMRFTREETARPIGTLSGGQKAKLLFLDMVLRGANVLLLDEPTRNFSPLSAPVVRKALQNFGGTIISVSHDRTYLSKVCDKVYVLSENGLSPWEETE